MRKRWGNFLQKAMAVLLAAVLCVGLIVGAEPAAVQAAERTYQFRLTVLGDKVTDAVKSVTMTDSSSTYTPTESIADGVITYEVSGVPQGSYKWEVRLGDYQDGGDFQASNSGAPLVTFCTVTFMDEAAVLYTRYVMQDSAMTSIPSPPFKEGYNFAGWVTEDGGRFSSSYKITKPTNIYSVWTLKDVEITQDLFNKKVGNIIDNTPASNSITIEKVEAYVKQSLDEYFQIDSVVEVSDFELRRATSTYAGYLSYSIHAAYGNYSASMQVANIYIPKLPSTSDRGWTLDEAGNLTITSQEGMDDWAQNGRTEGNNLSDVENVIIQDGVAEIPDNAFSGCGSLGAVSIPDTVTSIGDSAFAGASSLGEVTLPPNLGNIGNGAFSGCGSLEKVVMQGEIPPAIGDAAFGGCKFVEEPENTEGIVVPPGSGEAYRESAGDALGDFIKEQSPELTVELLDSRLQEILDNLSVSNDTTMDSVTSEIKREIDDYFHINSNVQPGMFDMIKATYVEDGFIVLDVTVSQDGLSVHREVRKTIPKLSEQDKGWTLDGDGTLTITGSEGMEDWIQNGRAEEGNLSEIKHIVIENGVAEIPNDAFSGCGNLEDVAIPDSVTGIGDSAFADNASLGSVTLPQGLRELGDGAFSGCGALDRVVMQGTEPPVIGDAVFDGCKFVKDNTEGIIVPAGSEDNYRAVWGDSLGGYITEKIPTVTEDALSKKLEEIFNGLPVSNEVTPDGIVNIIKGAIDSYFQIASTVQIAGFKLIKATNDSEGALELAVIVKAGESCSANIEGTIPITRLSTDPERGWILDDDKTLIIMSPAGMQDWVQTGRNEVNLPSIKGVVIQEGVTAIPDSAFKSCSNMESVALPGTVADIGDAAFAFASSLPSITLPQSVQSIGDEAFLGCDSLEKVVMQGRIPPSIGDAVFDNCRFTVEENSNGGIVVPEGSEDEYRDALGKYEEYIAGKKHSHSFADIWNFDRIHHWHECVSCGTPGNVAAHEWGEGNVVKEPTATEEGSRSYICSVCGAGRTEAIPATGVPSTSGNGNPGGNTPSTSGNDNPGSDIPSTSGNGNPGGNTPSTSGNDNPGGSTPPDSGNGNPGGSTPPDSGNGNPGGSTPPDSGNGSQSGGSGNPDEDKYEPANTPWTPEPKTGDGISTRLYATTAMIFGFTYLILLFSEKHGMTEEIKNELLSRLIRWAKYGGKLRRLLALAGIFLLLAYYHSIGKQVTAEEETGLTA